MQKLLLSFLLFSVCANSMEETKQKSAPFIPSIIELSNRTLEQVFIMDEQELRSKTAAKIVVNKTNQDDGKIWFSYNGNNFTLCYPHGQAATGPYTAHIDIKTACYLLGAQEIPPSTESYSAVQFFNDTGNTIAITQPKTKKTTFCLNETVYNNQLSEPIDTTFSLFEATEKSTRTISLNIEGLQHSIVCLQQANLGYMQSKYIEKDILTLYAQTIALLANGYELQKGIPKKEKSKKWLSCIMQ